MLRLELGQVTASPVDGAFLVAVLDDEKQTDVNGIKTEQ